MIGFVRIVNIKTLLEEISVIDVRLRKLSHASKSITLLQHITLRK